jgi:predicted Zn-dependent peptidase
MKQPDRTKEPAVRAVEKISFIEPVEETLGNGLKVYSIKAGKQDVIRLEFIFRAGNDCEPAPLVADFTARMLREGTHSYTSAEIAEKVDYHGAHLETACGHDWATVTLHTMNKYLHALLPVVEEVVKLPVFPAEEMAVSVRNEKQQFIVNNEKVRFIARNHFMRLIFGDRHPYGKLIGEEHYDTIAREDIRGFYSHRYSADNCVIMAAGRLPDDLLQLLDLHFGQAGWKGEQAKTDEACSIILPENRKHHITRKNALQTAIRIGRATINKVHPDYPGLQVLNTILGGYFGSRLMTNVREDKGYTYGIGSGLVSLRRSGYFFIASEVGADYTRPAVEEIYKEMEKLKTIPVPEEELSLVRNYMMGSFLRSIDGPFALADSFRSLWEYGLGYDHYRNFIRIIKGITAEELMQLANLYLDMDSMIELTVGDD